MLIMHFETCSLCFCYDKSAHDQEFGLLWILQKKGAKYGFSDAVKADRKSFNSWILGYLDIVIISEWASFLQDMEFQEFS